MDAAETHRKLEDAGLTPVMDNKAMAQALLDGEEVSSFTMIGDIHQQGAVFEQFTAQFSELVSPAKAKLDVPSPSTPDNNGPTFG